jgi:hypothetical protein
VPKTFLETIIRDLNRDVQGCVGALVFNLEEFGISDWEDRKAMKVIAPANRGGQTIFHAIS